MDHVSAKGMGTRLTIPISGPRPSPKENCMPSCRKKGQISHPLVVVQTSAYTEISGLRHFLSLSLWPWRNLGSGIALFPTSAIEWNQLVFLYGRLANRTGWGTLSGLHPLAS